MSGHRDPRLIVATAEVEVAARVASRLGALRLDHLLGLCDTVNDVDYLYQHFPF